MIRGGRMERLGMWKLLKEAELVMRVLRDLLENIQSHFTGPVDSACSQMSSPHLLPGWYSLAYVYHIFLIQSYSKGQLGCFRCLGLCEQCCNEHRSAYIFVIKCFLIFQVDTPKRSCWVIYYSAIRKNGNTAIAVYGWMLKIPC